jgi:hypothetical protein
MKRSAGFLAALFGPGLIAAVMLPAMAVSQSPAPVALGSATGFGVLASSTVTNTGATVVTGDLGVSPGTAVTGSPTVSGTIHAGDSVAAQGQNDLTTAYNDAAGRTTGAITVAGNLGGQTLAPGLYTSTSSLAISSGDLKLDAQGSANAVWIFQMASTLTTTTGRKVILTNGANAANIFWQVGSSATLGTTSVFKGTILAQASITIATGTTLEGRALARTGQVSLDTDTLTTPPPVGNATFQVNMKIKMLEGTFLPGSGDIVRVAGNMNNWGSSTDTLTDPNNDSIYTKTLLVPAGDAQYKFLKTLRAGLDWEGGNNRSYPVVAGDQTIPVVYWDNDSVYTPPVPANVTFQVNMRVKILEQTFQPGNGDIVRLAGSMNNWGSSTDTLTDPDHDSIYTKTISLLENQSVQYKFLKTLRAGLDWENINNRNYTVPPGGGTVAVANFDNDTVVNTPISANIFYQVDMRAYEQLGWFRPDLHDTMQLRGPFNGWGGEKVDPDALTPGVYDILKSYNGTAYDQIPFKFYMQLDSVTAVTRFPGYASNQDGVRYEHPATKGDGNRIFDAQTGGDISTPLIYFSDINPKGLLAAGDTVTVTIKANMGPATRNAINAPFNPATDTVRLIWQDALCRFAQVKLQGAFPDLLMSPVSPGDSIYQTTFDIIGPAHYGMMYTFRYYQPGGFQINQSGGLGGSNLFNSRYIQPLSLGKRAGAKGTTTTWPRSYGAPVDQWKDAAPLPAEVPPFDIVNGVGQDRVSGKPAAYRLLQNYPNPFNPATRIRYSLPERSRVSLKVFNLLGQEIATLVNQDQAVGEYVTLFDASRLPSGVYFYRLEAGKFLDVKKMLLVR